MSCASCEHDLQKAGKRRKRGEQMEYPIIIIVTRLYKETLGLTAIDGFLSY